MQLNENSIIPYPCLNVNISDDAEIPGIVFEITHRNQFKTSFTAKAKVANKDIEDLIAGGKAKYCCEMDCRRALRRMAYMSDDGTFCITLINNEYSGTINCTLSVVAVEDISDYKNECFDEFFKGFKVNMSAGEPLAYLGCFEIRMEDKSMDVKGLADDFIEIVSDDTLKFSRFELGEDKIILKLPASMYERYQNPRISQSNECESFLHASFLLNVLTSALQNIGTYQNTKWAETLRRRIETEAELLEIVGNDTDPFDNDKNLTNPECALDLAQAILDNPYERMFDKLENDIDTSGDE